MLRSQQYIRSIDVCIQSRSLAIGWICATFGWSDLNVLLCPFRDPSRCNQKHHYNVIGKCGSEGCQTDVKWLGCSQKRKGSGTFRQHYRHSSVERFTRFRLQLKDRNCCGWVGGRRGPIERKNRKVVTSWSYLLFVPPSHVASSSHLPWAPMQFSTVRRCQEQHSSTPCFRCQEDNGGPTAATVAVVLVVRDAIEAEGSEEYHRKRKPVRQHKLL